MSENSRVRDCLCAAPSMIAMAELRPGASPLTLALREFKRIDVVAFNREGHIVLIECKLVTSRMSTRTALGQIVERASLLWGRPISYVDRWMANHHDCSTLEEAMRQKLGASAHDWDRVAFRKNVQQALEAGDFSLIIAVDDDENERVTRAIALLHRHGLRLQIRTLKVHDRTAELLPLFDATPAALSHHG